MSKNVFIKTVFTAWSIILNTRPLVITICSIVTIIIILIVTSIIN